MVFIEGGGSSNACNFRLQCYFYLLLLPFYPAGAGDDEIAFA